MYLWAKRLFYDDRLTKLEVFTLEKRHTLANNIMIMHGKIVRRIVNSSATDMELIFRYGNTRNRYGVDI